MRISEIQFFRAVSPLSQPIADSTHSIPEIAFWVARVRSGDVVGEAYLLAFHYSPNAIRGALLDARELALGHDADDIEGFLSLFERESEYFGNTGLNRWAMALIEIALWDIRAQRLRRPVWRLFDVYHDRIPLYGSGGWLSYTIEELLDEVERYVGRGFQAVKVKVGSPELDHDIERLTKVREAVGQKVNIMMDANQGLTLDDAVRLARSVSHLRITWFEEPLSNADFDGYASLRRQADIQLAMGEREFNTIALRELARRGALDLWQPDIMRIGGVSRWKESADIAQVLGVPVLPHYYKEYDVPLLLTVEKARGAESFDWVDPLVENPIQMVDGFAYPSESPGWGFQFRDEVLQPL